MKHQAKSFSRFINESHDDKTDIVHRILASGGTAPMEYWIERFEEATDDISAEEVVETLIELTGATGVDDLFYVHSDEAYESGNRDLLDELNIVDRRSDSYAFTESVGGHNWKVTSMQIDGVNIPILIEQVMFGPGGFWAFLVSQSELESMLEMYDALGTENVESEDRLISLLTIDPIDISMETDKITVVVSGNDLGYDDDQYYEFSWFPSDNAVESGTFKDFRRTQFVTANNWSETVTTLEDFADIINGTAEGDWE